MTARKFLLPEHPFVDRSPCRMAWSKNRVIRRADSFQCAMEAANGSDRRPPKRPATRSRLSCGRFWPTVWPSMTPTRSRSLAAPAPGAW